MMHFKEWFEDHEDELIEEFEKGETGFDDYEEFVTSEYESALGDYEDAAYEDYKDRRMEDEV